MKELEHPLPPKRFVWISWLTGFENLLAASTILLMAVILFADVILRMFKTTFPDSIDYTKHLVVVLTFIAGTITSREKKHLALDLSQNFKESTKKILLVINMFLAVFVTTAFTWSSLNYTLTGFSDHRHVGIFPIRLIGFVIIIGFAVMTLRFILRVPRGRSRWFVASAVLLGTFIVMGAINNSLTALMEQPPAAMDILVTLSETFNAAIAVPLIIILIIGALLGSPLFVVLGGVALMLLARTGAAVATIPDEAYNLLTEHAIPAIPLFTVAGFILSESDSGKRLVRFFKAAFGWIPGGLAITAIMVCTFFTTFTGASGVTILALGALLAYILQQGKYKPSFNIGLLTASGSVGLLFPPALPIIIYGVVAGINVKHMFLGGILPGIVMVLVLVIYSIFYAVKNKTHRGPLDLKEAYNAFLNASGEIFLPILILVTYFTGLTTPVECAAIAVIYTLVLKLFIHRDLNIKQLPAVILKCIPIIGGVLIIISMAKGLNYCIVDAEIPTKLMEWTQANIDSKYVFLLLLNIILLITGCLMDIFSAIMVVVPLIIPLGQLFGIHPVHMGVIFLANMELGYMTPPVGLNLFLSSYRFNEPMSKLYKDVLPFLIIQLIAVLLITYIPVLSTALL